jgi:hypothetical protein
MTWLKGIISAMENHLFHCVAVTGAALIIGASPLNSLGQGDMPARGSIVKSMLLWKQVYSDIDSSSCVIFNRFPLEIICRCKCEDSVKVRDSLCKASPGYNNIRIKQGRKEFIKEAIARAGNYQFIADTLGKYGLHPDLKWLPVLESGFLDTMVSEAGAKGIWQFMESTAARFGFSPEDIVDPHRATSAFAQYFSALFGEFKDYGLALTAYHHGEKGIRAKLKKRRAKSLEAIMPDLGFESRNYYARFLSVLEIAGERRPSAESP